FEASTARRSGSDSQSAQMKDTMSTLAPSPAELPPRASRLPRPRLPRIRELASTGVGRGTLLFITYLILAIALTWPLATHLNSGITSAIDPVTSVWRLGWAQYQIFHDPLHVLSGNIFYPYANSYVFDGLELGIAILTLPLALTGLPPLAIYNTGILL